jgi:hypothetical protein
VSMPSWALFIFQDCFWVVEFWKGPVNLNSYLLTCTVVPLNDCLISLTSTPLSEGKKGPVNSWVERASKWKGPVKG